MPQAFPTLKKLYEVFNFSRFFLKFKLFELILEVFEGFFMSQKSFESFIKFFSFEASLKKALKM